MSNVNTHAVLISKSLNTEKRLATFLVLEPQDPNGTTSDLHGDWYDEDMVEESCYNFNRFCKSKANVLHVVSTDGYEFVESYITKSDSYIGDVFIKKGTWLATIFVKQGYDWIWEGILDGTFDGLSVQCTGHVIHMEEQ